MTDYIDAQVAALIDDYQLALNVGSNDGVRVGAEVRLYRLIEVTDPTSGDNLGSVRVEKVKLSVNHVQERLCVARVKDREEVGSVALLFSAKLIRMAQTTSEAAANRAPRDGLVQVRVGEAAKVEVARPAAAESPEGASS